MNDLPLWLGGQRCANCDASLPYSTYYEIGFCLKGAKKNKLFIRYECNKCECSGILSIGTGQFSLEKLCMFLVDQSTFINKSEKIQWKRNNLPYVKGIDDWEKGHELN